MPELVVLGHRDEQGPLGDEPANLLAARRRGQGARVAKHARVADVLHDRAVSVLAPVGEGGKKTEGGTYLRLMSSTSRVSLASCSSANGILWKKALPWRAVMSKKIPNTASLPAARIAGQHSTGTDGGWMRLTLDVPVDKVRFERVGEAVDHVLALGVEVETHQLVVLAAERRAEGGGVLVCSRRAVDGVAVVEHVEVGTGGVVERRARHRADGAVDVDRRLVRARGAEVPLRREGMPEEGPGAAIIRPGRVLAITLVEASRCEGGRCAQEEGGDDGTHGGVVGDRTTWRMRSWMGSDEEGRARD